MQHNVIAIRAWSREADASTDSTSLESVCLFSLFGLAVSAAVMFLTSPETVTTVTAALSQ